MLKNYFLIVVLLMSITLSAQNAVLPEDLRQHNLMHINSSLFNAAYSLDNSTSQSIALWSRWQWQSVDADPTSIFVNYNRKLGNNAAIGAGFIQNNTGVYTQTGGLLNFANNIALGSNAILGVGFNVLGYTQKVADTRFQNDSQIQLPQLAVTTDFIVQVAPGLNLQLNNFSIGVVAENLFDYNFTSKERSSLAKERVYTTMTSYSIPVSFFGAKEASITPMLYYKTVPSNDAQLGINTLYNSTKFWTQIGYNNFYGFSGGIGGHFLKNVSIGAIIEVGTSTDLKDKDPTFEIVTAYNFGSRKTDKDLENELAEKAKKDQKKIDKKLDNEKSKAEDLALKNAKKEEVKKAKMEEAIVLQNSKDAKQKAIQDTKTEKRNALLTKELEKKAELAREATLNKRKKDSLENIKLEEALAFSRRLRAERTKDSISKGLIALKETNNNKAVDETIIATKEVVKVQSGEKYTEVKKEGSLAPGYYLIANIFGTQRYHDAFISDMKKKGLQPASFYRAKNKYNYVYLGKYNTIKEARQARDSKLNGAYTAQLWIFRVIGE